MSSIGQGERARRPTAVPEAARKRAAIETYARHEEALRRTARRYSLCADDADDALQRALEILLLQGAERRPAGTGPLDPDRGQARGAGGARDRERILSGPAAVAPSRAARTGWR